MDRQEAQALRRACRDMALDVGQKNQTKISLMIAQATEQYKLMVNDMPDENVMMAMGIMYLWGYAEAAMDMVSGELDIRYMKKDSGNEDRGNNESRF